MLDARPSTTPRLSQTPTTRLAPSPTGALHLGNARTFLLNWALARTRGWRIILRVEDLDTPRVKAGAIEETVAILRWLGIDWDEGPVVQSEDIGPHREAMRRLAEAGLAYPCRLTRREIEAAASAPHAGEHELRFPPELRPLLRARRFEREETNWRLAVPDREISFCDGFLGLQRLNPSRTVGDFVVWTRRGQPSYQLAVVVDDARQGVTQVVRGADLLDSAARQMLLYEALGLGPPPAYTHLPLVVGLDGRRLAKRHGDTRLSAYREAGVSPERIIGLLGWWCGIGGETPEPMDAESFRARLDLCTMPGGDVVFRQEDDRWLRHAGL